MRIYTSLTLALLCLAACTPQIAATQTCDPGQVLVATAGGGWSCANAITSGDGGAVALTEIHNELSALDASVQTLEGELMTGRSEDIPNTLVLRDPSGSFSARTVSLEGALLLGDGGIFSGPQPVLETALGNRSVFLGVGGTVDGGLNANPIGDTLAVGFLALTQDTSGSRNTGVGTYALRKNSTGAGNTAVGYQAGAGNVAGDANTSIGNNAYSQGGGSNNVAVGEAALQQQAGSENTAVGAAAMVGALSDNGTSNAAFGANALRDGQSFNTAIGAGSLSFATGSYNIALGYNAGFAVASGGGNIEIGSPGVSTDVNTLRLGVPANVDAGFGIDKAFIAGVYGVNFDNSLPVVITPQGQLGTAFQQLRVPAEDAEEVQALRGEVQQLRAELIELSSRLKALEKGRAR